MPAGGTNVVVDRGPGGELPDPTVKGQLPSYLPQVGCPSGRGDPNAEGGAPVMVAEWEVTTSNRTADGAPVAGTRVRLVVRWFVIFVFGRIWLIGRTGVLVVSRGASTG